jgi:ornithine cyclodeaminase/alanine dehydrogenase-like protein (mu-crystallin family)
LTSPRFIGRAAIEAALGFREAADAIEIALKDGLDLEAEPDRTALRIGNGELLIMPSAGVGRIATVKLNSVGGDPRVQGVVAAFDVETLVPVALLDGAALTNLRTPAVSVVAARRLASEPPRRAVVFGRGPQGAAHTAALAVEFGIERLRILHSGSEPQEVESAVGDAELICCATTARTPLFDGDLVSAEATVIAVGSHEPDARELDPALVRRSAVVVESRRSAMAEAGDLVMAGTKEEELTTLGELLSGVSSPPTDRPRVFKSTGMGWEDAVVTEAILSAV